MDLITTHANADFDGLASMVAARKLYPGATLVLSGGAQEAVRNFLAVHDLGLARLKDIDLERVRRLVLVDVQEPARIGPLERLCGLSHVSIHIYDHHPDDQEHPGPTPPKVGAGGGLPSGAPSRLIDLKVTESVGATTTILVERLKEQALPISPFEATVLALGLYEETGSMAYASTTPRDLEAAAFVLRHDADLNMVSDTLRSHLDPELITLLNDLLHSNETFYLDGCKVLLATSTYDRYKGDLAEAVHKLAELAGLDAVIAAIAMDDKIEIIGRSRRPEIDVRALAQEFGGGGHPVAAAASVRGQTLPEIRERLARLLTERHRPTLLAENVMNTPVKAISDEATITEAEASLTKYGVNVLPVLDAKGRYRGIVSRETVQKALFHQLAKEKIVSIVQSDVFTAAPETPFHEIEGRMIEHNQRFVPVIRNAKVVGVITRTDLLRTLHNDVLRAARARAKGEEPESSPYTHNIRATLKEHLPQRLFALLQRAGELADRMDVSAYAVGGCVRDLLLGIPNFDLDLVIEGDGIAFARALGKEASARVKTHDRFGTAVMVFPDGFKLDVATARTEYYEYPTALPTVERSSIKKDLYRRDFTINALAIRLNQGQFGELIDFYGGRRDLKEKTIRVLHSLSFVDDPTRVFRAIRFEQRFGFHLGKETLTLIKGAVKMDLFHRLSGHRLLEELILLFSEEEPRKAIGRMAEQDLLRFIHPKLAWSQRLQGLLKGVEDALDWYKLLYLDRKMDAWLVYFMALMDVLPDKAVGETLARLTVPERYAEKIRAGRSNVSSAMNRLSRRPVPQPAEVYHLLEGLSDEALLLLLAKAKSESVKRQVSAYLTTYRHVKPSLTGKDLQTMGLKPGPLFKKILTRLADARLNSEVKSEADERELVKRMARQ